MWAGIRARAGLPGLHMHDLRHTVASYLVDTGADPFTVAACLNHRLAGVTAIYVAVSEERRRAAMVRATDRMWELGRR